MSDFVDPKYTPRQLQLQMVNAYVHIHDLHCNCKSPLKHIIKQIEDQEPSLKCRDTTTEKDGDHAGEGGIDDFGPGELERLFAEDVEEKQG